MVKRYILPLDLQHKWVRTVEDHPSREWVAGLKLRGETIDWFGFIIGSQHEVKPINLRAVSKSIGTVHYHPYEHTETPIPSSSDGINWVYHSFWEISEELNPIFFIVFRDGYASWAMFPRPPLIRRIWHEEYIKVREEEKASINLCLRLLEENMVKAGILRLGEKDQEFLTFRI